MTFKNTSLAVEVEKLQEMETEMYELYSGLAGEVKNEALRKQIKTLRDQEMDHLEMVANVISILDGSL
jgi:rubrerythrin